MRHTLREQPPPRTSTFRTAHTTTIRPPLAHPIVESWLESIHPSPTSSSNKTNQPTTTIYAATTKPVTKQFDQLPVVLQDVPVNRSKKVWLVICRILRAVSFILATASLAVLAGSRKNQERYGFDRFIPTMTFCALVMLWSLVDLVTAAFRRGKGISPRAHVYADCVLAMGMAFSASFVLVDIFDWVGDAGREHYHDVPAKIAIACFLFLIMIIHIYLFFFFYYQRARTTRHRRELYTPRIMFLPSGAAVMVTPQPVRGSTGTSRLAPGPVPIEMRRIATTSAASRPTPSDGNHSMESRRMGSLNIVIPQPPTLVATRSPLSAAPVLPPTVQGATQTTAQARHTVPARKPVAAVGTVLNTSTSTDPGPSFMSYPATMEVPVGTHYASQWPGPDYQPDEAELERAARGEAQAQWMSLHGMDLRRDRIR